MPTEAREAERPGAFLTLPPIEHTARAMLNGISLPPLDFSKPRVDLTDHLQCGEGEAGKNILEVVVTTNLFNAVKAYADQALFMGLPADDMGAEFDAAVFVEVGLLGPVQVTWVEWESSDLPTAESGSGGIGVVVCGWGRTVPGGVKGHEGGVKGHEVGCTCEEMGYGQHDCLSTWGRSASLW
ncbi:hypothetical protein B0A52_10366 [Exophiala mesophila]|uniref:Uncharacterized protein n=1 Tax=Exophiala mesophila TaxID=212818 RepID=A0A438MQC4_EXOME|nr:hypothetical protein B0A52_10366 [Exophiala mesophila]